MGKLLNEQVLNKIRHAIDMVRPYLVADGGDVELIDVSDELVVKVKLTGACEGCPFSVQTLKAGIEQAIRNEVPELKELISVS